MKRIIGGKRYDTTTAQEMAEYSHSYPRQFEYYHEVLYRKRTGEFFLWGEGGPASKYRERTDLNSWSSGEAITPLTYEEATKWAETHLEGDEYEEIFGPVDESLEAVTVAYSLPTAAAALIKREAEKTGKPQSRIISDLIMKAFGPEAK